MPSGVLGVVFFFLGGEGKRVGGVRLAAVFWGDEYDPLPDD